MTNPGNVADEKNIMYALGNKKMDEHNFKHIVRTLLSGLAPQYGATLGGVVGVEDGITWSDFVKRMTMLFEKHPFEALRISEDIKEELSSIKRTLDGNDVASEATQETSARKRMRTAFGVVTMNHLPTHSLQSVLLKMMTNKGKTIFAQKNVDKEAADHAISNAQECIALINTNSEDDAENWFTLFRDDKDRRTLLQHFDTSIPSLFDRVHDENGDPTDAFHTDIGEAFESEANTPWESLSAFTKVDVDPIREMKPILIKDLSLEQLSMTDPFVRSTTFYGFECLYRSKNHVFGAVDIGKAFCVTSVSTNQPAPCPPVFNDADIILKRMRTLYGYQMLDDISKFNDRPDLFRINFPKFNLEEQMGCTLPRDIFPNRKTPQLVKMELFKEMKALWEEHTRKEPVWDDERKEEFKRIIHEDWIQSGPPPVKSTTTTPLVGPTPKQAVDAYCAALVETQTQDQLQTLINELKAL